MFLVGISSFIVALAVSWAVTPFVIRLAGYLGAVDLPDSRKTHLAPMPRIGGLAVFCGFFSGLAFAAFSIGALDVLPESGVYWPGLGFAACGLLVIGMIDDTRGLSFQWKFAAQIVAAIYVWNCGFKIENISHPLGGSIEFDLLSFPLTVLWIVGITNAVNLIDGLDGLAGGIALITTVTVAAIAFYRGDLGVTAASVALAGSLIGFLPYNFNPARIFLGDSGSLFLGFVLAVTSVRGSQKGPTMVAILVPLLVLGLPLLDTSLAVLRRLYRLGHRGMKSDDSSVAYVIRNFSHVFLPDRGHLHHQLMDLGLSHRRAVLVLYGVGGLFALAALGLVTMRSVVVAGVLVGVLLLTMATFLVLLYLRIDRGGRPEDPGLKTDDTTGEPREPETATEGFVSPARGELGGRP
jgi:UDP-GlcNAc:undecaprenyl-phosphate GlcNAc-1-phosphate transferase